MRVRMALHEKELTFETCEEDLKNFSPRLRQIHPEGKVPALVHGENILYESSIITEYLEDAFPETTRLMPSEAGGRAQVRLWTYWCNQLFKPQVDRVKYGESRFPKAECEAAPAKLIRHLEKLETQLGSSPWLVGDTFSLADIHLFPFARQLAGVTPALPFRSNYPALQRWVDTVAARPSFEKTMRA
jgi:glutathione S-transferase